MLLGYLPPEVRALHLSWMLRMPTLMLLGYLPPEVRALHLSWMLRMPTLMLLGYLPPEVRALQLKWMLGSVFSVSNLARPSRCVRAPATHNIAASVLIAGASYINLLNVQHAARASRTRYRGFLGA
jgi:hypothetical protein